MEKFKISRIVALLGSIISIIASFLPATYKAIGRPINGFSYKLVILRWFWGFWYRIYTTKSGSLHYFGFWYDYFGIVSGFLLLGGGIIGIGIFNNFRKEPMEPKKGGALLIIFGILSIIFITFWSVFWRILEIYKIKRVVIPFGVIFGYIGSALITIAGISILCSRRKKFMKKRKIIENIPMVGGFILLIAIILPTVIFGTFDIYLIFFWFWGLFYRNMPGDLYYPNISLHILFDLISFFSGISLVIGAIIGLGFGYNLRNQYMGRKKGGTFLILFGLLSIIFLIIWIMFTPIGKLSFNRYSYFRPSIPLGVILGFIGNALIIIGGIHVLISQRKGSIEI